MVKILTSALVASLATMAAASSPALLARADSVKAPTPGEIKALQDALILQPGEERRLKQILLPNPPDASNITFQFTNNSVTGHTGGTIALTTLNNFPALLTTNVAMAIGFVNPCGLNVPHNHPRANEFLTVIQGKLIGGLILEDEENGNGQLAGQAAPPTGATKSVNATLENYTGMLFPQGTTHFQFNNECTPALFAAAFDNADPGRTQIARNFFSGYPDEMLIASIGGNLETLDASRIGKFRSQIPPDFAVLMEGCAKKCGIAY